ncbi:NAD(P)-dependent oxidoreductase [Acidocella sp.]|uniref:NAD-dependent epimerase/dehydratase family protein n=1 Tax=Acidocella sp. TaxID=50710 RepID=UPI00261FB430|nr:NAD(P)-dependent oxidoreductase [Acidocella sp.]
MFEGPVIITGAGGWLGQAALELAARAGAEIYAFGATARMQTLRDGRVIAIRALGDLPRLEVKTALVLHMAFLTREHASGMELADYMATNRAIAATVEAYIRRQGARGVFVPSSGAAYGAGPYGEGKREDEARFGALGRELGVPCVVMRVFNLAGPFINKLTSYALACIIRDLLAGGPVRLRAEHPVWRGYAHVFDVLNIALGLLAAGESPPVFDSWGEPVELSELAARAAAVLGRPLTIERPAWQNGAADVYLGDATPYLAHAARLGLQPAALTRQIEDTADYLGRCFSI